MVELFANRGDPDQMPHSGFVLGFNVRQPLWVIFCRLPEKGRREIVKEMKERDRGERKMNDSEETEEIKTFPLYPYLLQG